MVWKATGVADQRIGFIHDYLSDAWSMTGLCERYGISRKAGYKWSGRYGREGLAGLADRPRAPLVHGRLTAPHLVEAITLLRRERPSWGPRKIIAKLSAREPDAGWPCASTAGEILKRAGLVSGRRIKRRGPPRLGELTAPLSCNHVWAVDHKGWVRLGDGARAEPLTITDGFSRFLIRVSATGSTRHDEAKPMFEQAFLDFGLPEVIRSDNGTPFASVGAGGLTRLSAWWIRLGIAHERTDPGHPQQNGRHERFHLTLKEAMYPLEPDRAAQERRFTVFTQDYNYERPHEALGQKPPGSVYRPSPRPLPASLPDPDYPPEAAVRQVRSNGEIKWAGTMVYISEALIGEAVGVRETATGEMQVSYFKTALGIIEPKTGKLRAAAATVNGGGGGGEQAINQ